MSAFDAKVRIASAGVQLLPEDPTSEDSPVYEAELVQNIMAVAPIGPGQAIPIPFGTLRIPLDKASVTGLVEQLIEARDRMSERPPQIETAQSLAGVERAAEVDQKLRG